mgnify:CR=1 FL=1
MSDDTTRSVEDPIPASLAGERLDRVVSLMADVSRSVAATMVANGGVQVDGAVENSGKIRLEEGQLVRVDLAFLPAEVAPQPDQTISIDVLYEDADVIVINKPAGLVVHPGAGNPDGTLVNGLLARFPEIRDVGESSRPGIVHRLDAGTSGLMMVARTQQAYEHLVEMLSTHQVRRTYLALVAGIPEAKSGLIDAPIGRDQRDPLRMAVSVSGRFARTQYEVLQEFSEPIECALVRCDLETGRTHQIRVHLGAIGHPVIGDALYKGVREGLKFSRPALHAAVLAFEHPVTGDEMTFDAPLTQDFNELLGRLEPAYRPVTL